MRNSHLWWAWVLAWACTSVPAVSKASKRKKPPKPLALKTFTLDVADVRAMAFSGDGRMAVTGHWNETAKLWDTRTGILLQTLRGHTGVVLSVAFCNNGAAALTGSSDGSAKVWDTSTGKELHTLTANAGWVVSVACAQEEQVALTGSNDDRAHLWDISTGRLLSEIGTSSESSAPVPAVAFGRNRSRALVGYKNGSVTVLDAGQGSQLLELAGHKGWVVTAAVSPDGAVLLTGSHDNTARVWNATTGRQRHILKSQSIVACLAFDYDGKTAITGSRDGSIKHWDVSSGKLLKTYKGKKSPRKSQSPDDDDDDDDDERERILMGTSLRKGASVAAVAFALSSCGESEDATCPAFGADQRADPATVLVGILAPLKARRDEANAELESHGKCMESCAAQGGGGQAKLVEVTESSGPQPLRVITAEE